MVFSNGISFRCGWGVGIQNDRSVGKDTKFNSRDDIYVKCQEYVGYFHCTLDEIKSATWTQIELSILWLYTRLVIYDQMLFIRTTRVEYIYIIQLNVKTYQFFVFIYIKIINIQDIDD